MDETLASFVRRLVASTEGVLGDHLLAMSLVGSLATGDAHPPTSDIDVLVVIDRTLDGPRGDMLADEIGTLGLACPWSGVEYVVYPAHVLRAPAYPLPYMLNINAGPHGDRHVSTGDDPAHWFLLDVAMAREHSIPLRGPRARDLIADPSAADVLRAIQDALAWHAAHHRSSPDAVLNACRSWQWIDTRRWTSKTEAGRWALGRTNESADGVVVADALTARRRRGAQLDADQVTGLLTRVGRRAEAALPQ